MELLPFQREGAAWLRGRRKALLIDEMGLGKTVQVLAALEPPAIVVAPLAVLWNWHRECGVWRPDLAPVVIRDKKKMRPPKGNEVMILGYDTIPETILEKTFRLRETTLVVDECHRTKNGDAIRTRKVRRLRMACDFAWFLSGTPMLGTPLDLLGVIKSLGALKETYGTEQKFLDLFECKLISRRPERWVWTTCPPVQARIHLFHVAMRRTKAQVLPQLPKKRYHDLLVEMGDVVAGELDAVSAEILARGTGWSVPPSHLSRQRRLVAEDRIPAMLDVVSDFEAQEEPLVVFSAHRGPVDILANRTGWVAVHGDCTPGQREQAVNDYQAGRVKGIALTIRAGGEGITLTHGSNVLFIDREWTPALNEQAEDRVLRIGQRADAVQIIRFVSTHPVDRHIHFVLDKKETLIRNVLG